MISGVIGMPGTKKHIGFPVTGLLQRIDIWLVIFPLSCIMARKVVSV